MLRLFAVSLLLTATLLVADEKNSAKLAAPEGWSGETIELPPGFAPDMKLKGSEHIRFAPGMMKPASDSFFSYAFVFELQSKPDLADTVVKDEFLKYYRGLCMKVLDGKAPDVDPSQFTLELQRLKSDAKPQPNDKDADAPVLYTGVLDWVEPFATKKPQKLNLEIRTWARTDRNYIFACVSPQARETAIWKQLHAIRDAYLEKVNRIGGESGVLAVWSKTSRPRPNGWIAGQRVRGYPKSRSFFRSPTPCGSEDSIFLRNCRAFKILRPTRGRATGFSDSL